MSVYTQPASKKAKKVKKEQHCIENHRLIIYGAGHGKITEAQMCTKLEGIQHKRVRVHQFNILFAAVYEVAELLGGLAPDIALHIMPYLVHRGDSNGLFDDEDCSDSEDDQEEVKYHDPDGPNYHMDPPSERFVNALVLPESITPCAYP